MRSNVLAAFTLASVLIGAMTPPGVQAQSTVDQQQLQLAEIQADKRLVVFKFMELADDQVVLFTPVYDAYHAEYKKLLDRAVALIDRYASDYGAMTEDDAAALLKEWFRLKHDEDRLIETYAGKLTKTLSPLQALRFVQIESQLTTSLRLTALRDMPIAPQLVSPPPGR